MAVEKNSLILKPLLQMKLLTQLDEFIYFFNYSLLHFWSVIVVSI